MTRVRGDWRLAEQHPAEGQLAAVLLLPGVLHGDAAVRGAEILQQRHAVLPAEVGELDVLHLTRMVIISAANRSIGSTTGCTITEKAPTRAFSWLKAPTSAFTFKTLLRHYAKRALTPQSVNVKLGPQHKSHKGRAVWLA